MKVLFTVCFAALCSSSFSQQVVNVDKSDGMPLNSFFTVNGSPFVSARYVRLTEGTPYFKNSWMRGIAISDKRSRYQNKQVKLDLLDNELHYLNENGEEFICTIPLKEVQLTDTVSGISYRFIHSTAVPLLSSGRAGWYLQLVEGKASLYQYFKKDLQESKPYGSSVAEQRIITTEEFLVAYKGALVNLKKLKDLPGVLLDKKEELEKYLKNHDAKNISYADRLTALVAYYNSLN